MEADIKTLLDQARRHLATAEPDLAEELFRRILQTNPGHVEAVKGLAEVFQKRGDFTEAVAVLKRGLDNADRSPILLEALGDAYHARGMLRDTIDAYTEALNREPDRPGALWGLGCGRAALGDYAAAVESFARLADLRPDFGEGHHNLGRSLYELGEVDLAFGAFQRAVGSLAPTAQGVPLANIAMVAPGSPTLGEQEIFEIRRAWATHCLPPGTETGRFEDRDRRPDRPLRLGYVSAYFSRRNWMKPVWGLLNRHDRDRFEIHLFSDGPEPPAGQGYAKDDRDRFHETSGLSNEALSKLVQAERIDILIDLNGYSKLPRLELFALRAAPVQASWFNMFATSGLKEIDYLVGDDHVIPAAEEGFHTETIIRVPGSYLTFEVGYAVPDVSPPPFARNRFVTFGCLAPQYKITPDVVEAWSRILNACPTARLVLKNAVLEHPSAREFVRARFAQRGISADRLDLEGPAEHHEFLACYAGIDAALDTFPYNGGTTTMEALWQGVPVLCFTGDRWAARISASLMREAGLAEFVASNLEAHIEQAVKLAHDPAAPGRLASLRASMRDRLRKARVCDVAAFARNMENAYREMWRWWSKPNQP